MFPISELTFAFSQLLSIILELRITGPPRRFWMFRFEALHKLLKSYLRNVAKPIASIAKNFAVSERARQLMAFRIANPAAMARFFERVGGCMHLCGTRLVLLKLNQLHVEFDDEETIVHIVKQSRMIDVHGQPDLYSIRSKIEAADLFQAVYDKEMASNEDSVGCAAYDMMYCRDKRTKKSFLAWISELGERHPRIPHELYEPLANCVSAKGIEQAQSDWTDLIKGIPPTLNIFQSCTVCGVSVSSPWKYSHGVPERQRFSFQTIRDLSLRQKPPTVLSWFVYMSVLRQNTRDQQQQQRLVQVQVFGIPLFFFRFSFTSDCVDQAYCAFALIPRGVPVDKARNATDAEIIVKSYTTEQFSMPFAAKKIEGINYFVRVCDIIHCRYGLGFDPIDTTLTGNRANERVTFIPMDYESLKFAQPYSGLRQYGYDIGDGEIG
jgi:hypothetical protein